MKPFVCPFGKGYLASLLAQIGTLLMYASQASDGTPHLFAIDKTTGEELARVEVPAVSRYGMMTYVHEGKQYVILQTGPSLTAIALADF